MNHGRVVVTEHIDPAGLEILKRETELLYLPDVPGRTLADTIVTAAGIGVRLARVTSDLMATAPNLKVIAKHGVGYDNIDVAAATARGIVVVHTPKANSVSVAEHILSLMLCLANRVCKADRDLKAGRFQKREDYTGVELNGKTLGVVGLGRIGSETARICSAGFGMSVVAYDPFVPSETFERTGHHRADSLVQLLDMADFVVLCVPFKSGTAGMIGAHELSLMKSGSFLVNTARGGLVDEAALYESLVQGHLAGAAIDAFVDEPPPVEHPLLSLPNFIATPHVAGQTTEAMRRMATDMAEEILRVLRGERPLYSVNPEVNK
ncbi:MAG: hydroxyacid dehydrogenase [Dehalococcoidia bacterium]|nr:hydroxyacid dehydrogenase [Dehalococcoidia bacterium]